MASLATIFNSPYYFGEISFDETKKVLSNKPPHSYLFRKLKNGSITLAAIHKIFRIDLLVEIEIKNCNCEGTFLPIQQFKSLEDFIEYCNFVFMSLWTQISYFKTPIFRKNPFSLEEISKSCTLVNYRNSLDSLIIPKVIKQNLKLHHDHFEIMYNEKEAIGKFNSHDCQELFRFKVVQGELREVQISITNWKKWMNLDSSNEIKKQCNELGHIPKFTLLNSNYEIPIKTERDKYSRP